MAGVVDIPATTASSFVEKEISQMGNRLYRARRMSTIAMGMVIVSVCNDIVGARRRLLEPVFGQGSDNCMRFEWGVEGHSTALLALAILRDHFDANAEECARVEGATSALDAAVKMHKLFADKVIAMIPHSQQEWSMTTSALVEFMDYAAGQSDKIPGPIVVPVEPGHGARNGFSSRIVIANASARIPNLNETDEQEVNAFIERLRHGRIGQMPERIARAILETFVDEIRKAFTNARQVLPRLSVRIGAITMDFDIVSDRSRINEIFGASIVRSAFITAEELLGVETLSAIFGTWTPEV